MIVSVGRIWVAKTVQHASIRLGLTVVPVRLDGLEFTALKGQTDATVVLMNRFAATEFVLVSRAKEEATSAYASKYANLPALQLILYSLYWIMAEIK